jgi:hypothetical protein
MSKNLSGVPLRFEFAARSLPCTPESTTASKKLVFRHLKNIQSGERDPVWLSIQIILFDSLTKPISISSTAVKYQIGEKKTSLLLFHPQYELQIY